jgi:catechol 2,3-dioxygenase-like lactoylglutathione lyase family enzyme
MSIQHLLAAVAVTDLDRSRDWYEKLLGRAPDNEPMPNLVEWQVLEGAWVQVFIEAEHAGSSMVNLAVEDLAAAKADLADRGLEPGETQEANKGVELSTMRDPDGNAVTLIGGFRVEY